MKVKLKTGFWEVREYCLSVEDTGLQFHSDEREWIIPFSELVRFSLTGVSKSPDRFTMETINTVYDGRFTSTGDGREFVSQLSKRNDQKVEINLTTEKPILIEKEK